MPTTPLNLIIPFETPLPPPREGGVLTDAQWTTLMAIADTIIPSIEVSSEPLLSSLSLPASVYTTAIETVKKCVPPQTGPEVPTQYFQETASSIPAFRALLHRTLSDFLREDVRKGIRVILSALDTRAGCLLTTGYSTSFHLQPVNIRQQILQSWSQCYLRPIRASAKALQSLVTATWVRTSPTIGPMLGFPRSPVHGKPGKGYEYSFIQFAPSNGPEFLDTDVVIIGSGCGGGVCAKNLAEAGHRVIVCEKSYHWGPEHLPMTEQNSGIHLFANGGLIASDSGNIACIAGQAFGGGGTVNWSASLQTQAFVRKEWAEGGLPFFTSSEYQKSLDRVCSRMGVSTQHVEHNRNNQILAEGARKLGYSHKAVPQNTGGNQHYCGYCTLGCGAAEKQGPVVSFLPDAERAGAQFVEGFEAHKVIFSNIRGKRKVTGVEGTWTSRDSNGGVSGKDRISRRVIIKAKRVIVSSGTLQSPLLLLRSGLSNPQIGRNLHLHPSTLVTATYPDQSRINPWEGAILTQLVDEFQNQDGHNHGCKLECMTMLPSWVMPFQVWRGGLEYKTLCTKMPWMSCHLVLVRDRDTGRVYPDPVDGACRIAYNVSNFDKKHALEGLIAAAKVAYVEGANEIFLAHGGIPAFVRPGSGSGPGSGSAAAEDNGDGINDAAFQAWLLTLRKRGLPPVEVMFGTAHQMGTCRMAVSERAGVVDPKGKVWGTEGLYVADASVFPSASGVNPMVTTMAISDWISRGVAQDLERQGGMEERARL
ncbi:MAG: hypothetical protein Q9217_001281 [Psora testacea]